MTLTIQELGERVSKNSALLERWLASKNTQALSFEVHAAPEFPSTAGEAEIEAARLSLLDDTDMLSDLLLGPGEVLRRICWGSIDNAVQQCLYSFGFLKAIPVEGPGVPYPDLAAKVGLPEPQVKALVRQSIMNRVLRETPGNPLRVAHTASSALLLRDNAMMDWYGHCVEEMFPAGARLAEALVPHGPDRNGETPLPQKSAFGLAFDTAEPLYKFFEQHPKRQARFFGAMQGVGQDPGHSLDHVVKAYPWDDVGSNVTVVDVGGSSGFMSVALAQAHPNLKRLVVQDYRHTVEEGAAQLPRDLVGRVEFMSHDFFAAQPVAGADIYILRHICHNWNSSASVKILQAIIPVMKPTSKILLVEVVVLDSGKEVSRMAERYMRNVDVTMLQMLNTQERSEAEWREVVRATHPSLELTRIFKPKGSWDSVIEISFRLN